VPVAASYIQDIDKVRLFDDKRGETHVIRTAAPLCAALLLATTIPMAQAASAPKPRPPIATQAPAPLQEKVVYHVNDSSVARAAMRNAMNHISASPDAKIVVVTHSKGIDFLLNDAKDEKGEPYQPQVIALKEKGIEFRVCRNTLKSRNLDDSAVILDATVVPSGVAEIGRLQAKEGFVYLKP
jgi:intracellular sulfur oxidation DsrE/DsrF family protein